MDALYFRVSTDRQTTEHQFEDLLLVAERDGSDRDWIDRAEVVKLRKEGLSWSKIASRLRPLSAYTKPVSARLEQHPPRFTSPNQQLGRIARVRLVRCEDGQKAVDHREGL